SNVAGMNTSIPLFRQERSDTCALACLRLVLAAFGTDVDEETLARLAVMEPGGTEIREVERMSHYYGLKASTQTPTLEQLDSVLKGRNELLPSWIHSEAILHGSRNLRPGAGPETTTRRARVSARCPPAAGARTGSFAGQRAGSVAGIAAALAGNSAANRGHGG